MPLLPWKVRRQQTLLLPLSLYYCWYYSIYKKNHETTIQPGSIMFAGVHLMIMMMVVVVVVVVVGVAAAVVVVLVGSSSSRRRRRSSSSSRSSTSSSKQCGSSYRAETPTDR